MGIILLILCIIVIAIAFYYRVKYNKITTLQNLNQKIQNRQDTLTEVEQELSDALTTASKYQTLNLEKKEELLKLETDISTKTAELKALSSSLQTVRDNNEIEKAKICEEFAEKIQELNIQHQTLMRLKNEEVKNELAQMDAKLESERSKYLSVIETVQRSQSEEEKDLNHHIQISSADRSDINYLLNHVAEELRNPDILYKLIWSEYIQKKANEMLDYILPSRECSGIYKITNDRTKQAYIGRSTSVRKRLTDHIKSSVGISTIADQRIHQAMRDEGIWNFTFELIEECSKEQLNEREKYYINFFSTEKLGYNQKAGG